MNLQPSQTTRELIACLELVYARHDVLAGGRAVEAHVGRQAISHARQRHGVSPPIDIDMSVSWQEYKRLKSQLALEVTVKTHGHSEKELESLEIDGGIYDIWCEQWYEASRTPAIIAHSELLANSEWNDELGINVLARDYLIVQRQRSIALLKNLDTRTPTQGLRLAKDKADFEALTSK